VQAVYKNAAFIKNKGNPLHKYQLMLSPYFINYFIKKSSKHNSLLNFYGLLDANLMVHSAKNEKCQNMSSQSITTVHN